MNVLRSTMNVDDDDLQMQTQRVLFLLREYDIPCNNRFVKKCVIFGFLSIVRALQALILLISSFH